MEWHKFRAWRWFKETSGMTQAEKGDYMDATAEALCEEKPMVTALADSMLEETAEISAKQRARIRARWEQAKREKEGDTAEYRGIPRRTKLYHREEKRGEEKENNNGYRRCSSDNDGDNGGGRQESISIPPPPGDLAEYLSDCPATWPEVEAKAEAAGCKREWLVEWARHNHEQEWTYNRREGARRGSKAWVLGTIEKWVAKQKEMDASKPHHGIGGPGDVTIPGVRVSSKGGVPDMGF